MRFSTMYRWGFVFFLSYFSLLHAVVHKTLVIDTAFKEELIYKRFFSLAEQAGLDITYLGLGDLIDTAFDDIQVEKYDIVFFLIDSSVVASLESSPLSQKVIRLIQKRAGVSQAITALFLPSFASFAYRHLTTGHPLTAHNELFKIFGLSVQPMGNFQMQSVGQQRIVDFSGSAFKGKAEQLLKNPCGWAGGYATSLQPKSDTAAFGMHVQGDTLGFFIPTMRKEHRLFLANIAIASYASIEENFRMAPLDVVIQKKLDEDMLYGFLKMASVMQKLKGIENDQPEKKLDDSLLEGKVDVKPARESKKVLAWMDIEVFADESLKDDQERLIQSLLRAEFDALWLSIAPNQYFSVRAKFFNRREQLGKSIQVFSEQLKQAFEREKKKLPEILIGFEIANNFVDDNKYPEKSMIDLFGNTFKDVPEPLDRSWWRDEILISAERFMPFWRVHAPGLEVAGFFIDLEMYMRHESKIGEFVNCAQGTSMHQEFSFKDQTLAEGGHAIVQELMELKRGKEYYRFLTKQAEDVGSWIKRSLQQIVPNCRVACYAVSITLDWFYRGFYKGLSSEQDPLWLCSFNSRYDWFRSSCIEKGFFFQHFAVLMLSHMKAPEDFSLFNTLSSRNDGVWLNKVSRLAHEYRSAEWHVLEQTPLSYADRARFLDVVAKK